MRFLGLPTPRVACDYVSGSSCPINLPLPGRVVDLASGGSFTLALLEDGTILTWGKNSEGQLGGEEWMKVEGLEGPSTRMEPLPPRILEGKGPVVGFGCIYDRSFVVLEGGKLLLWEDPEFSLTVHLPKIPSKEYWEKIFQWMFLGRKDPQSLFFSLPVEVLYHTTYVGTKRIIF